jgi:membrane-associated phospholipid phosphatase
MFRDFFYRLPQTLVRCFTGNNTFWHLLAIGLTYACVTSGFDWWYYEMTRSELIFDLAFPSSMIGFFVPALVPLAVYVFGAVRKSLSVKNLGAALMQAVIVGSFISDLYKAFTGRLQPQLVSQVTNIDISGVFNFGFLRHGIFWGWPSSHTTVAFAMSAVIIALFPRNKTAVTLAVLYALYIGLGVSVTIHWFSDFVAGAILGTVIGLVIARSYRNRVV